MALRAIRDNDVRAAFVGIPVRLYRWRAFVISGAVVGLAGGLYGQLDRQVTPEQLGCPAYAPGVSHREPGGLSPRQVIDWLHAIEQPIVGADVVEYNPRCDFSNVTATVAAKLVKEIAGMMLKTAG